MKDSSVLIVWTMLFLLILVIVGICHGRVTDLEMKVIALEDQITAIPRVFVQDEGSSVIVHITDPGKPDDWEIVLGPFVTETEAPE